MPKLLLFAEIIKLYSFKLYIVSQALGRTIFID